MRHFTVHMTPYTCANGAQAGPYRVSGVTDARDAIRSAEHMWSPDRTVVEVEETDGWLDEPTVLATFDAAGNQTTDLTRRMAVTR